MQESQFLAREGPFDASRNPQDERPRWNLHPFRHKSPRADQALLANNASVQKNRPHANQTIIADTGAMNDRPMADGDPFSQNNGYASGRVHDGGILDIGSLTDRDALNIPPQNNRRPDRGFLADMHAADNFRRVMNKSGGM